MKQTRIYRLMSLLLLTIYAVISIGCARQYINDKVQGEAVKQIDAVDVAGTAAMISTAFFTWFGMMINRYIKNQNMAAIVISEAQKWDKDMERFIAAGLKKGLEFLKGEIGEIDWTRPLLPQFSKEVREHFNAIKHQEVKLAVLEKYPGAEPDQIDEIIKQKAPGIRPTVAPESTEPKKITFLSPESNDLIEKLRKKYQ